MTTDTTSIYGARAEQCTTTGRARTVEQPASTIPDKGIRIRNVLEASSVFKLPLGL